MSPVERLEWLAAIAADTNIPSAALRVAVALAKHQNGKTGQLNPGVPTLVKASNLKERAMRGSLYALKAEGYLDIKGVGRGRTRNYRLIQPKNLAQECRVSKGTWRDDAKFQGETWRGDANNPENLAGNGSKLGTSVQPEQGVEHGKNKDIGSVRKKKPFRPPTEQEVAAYVRQRGSCINPNRFVNHYTSNGWMVGKNKMVDWKAAVRTWEQNERNPSQQHHQTEPVQRIAGGPV